MVLSGAFTVIALAMLGLADAGDTSHWCDAMNHPDVRKLSIRYPRHKVNTEDTTYMCYSFLLPDDQEYHIVAIRAVNDQQQVLHHQILSRCHENIELTDEPRVCNTKSTRGCSETFHFWAHGQEKLECFPPQAGLRFGKGVTSNLMLLNIHYNNPHHLDNVYDESGMDLFYTPKLRQHDMGIIVLGQDVIALPPNLPMVTAEATCTARCSRKILKGPIQIFQINAHLHGAGRHVNISVSRQGNAMQLFKSFDTSNPEATYDVPFTPFLTLNPGDALKTVCQYNTTGRNFTTLWGWGGTREHCFSTSYYFPFQNLRAGHRCAQEGTHDRCDYDFRCERNDLLDAGSSVMKPVVDRVLEVCSSGCNMECQSVVMTAVDNNYCLREQWPFMRNLYQNSDPIGTGHVNSSVLTMIPFMHAVESCKP